MSLVLAARQVVFGGRVQLTGTVPTHTAGEQVVVFSKPYGIASARSVATVLTGANGVWRTSRGRRSRLRTRQAGGAA